MNQVKSLSLLFALFAMAICGLFDPAAFAQPPDVAGGGGSGSNQEQEPIVHVYRPRNVQAEFIRDVAAAVLDETQDSNVQILVETSSNSLIIRAQPHSIEKLVELIRTLDQDRSPAKPPQPKPVNLVVQLVFDEAESKIMIPMSTPVSERIEEILEKAADDDLIQPLANPKVATRCLVRINPGFPNSQEGRWTMSNSSAQSVVSLALTGHLHQYNSNTYQLMAKIKIQLSKLAGKSEPKFAEIKTDAMITKGHPVLLSVNTIEGYDFLILVEAQ